MKRNEEGVFENHVFNRVVLLIVLAIVAFATFKTGQVNDELADTQSAIAQTQQCTVSTLSSFARAVNERTEPNTVATQANVELQKQQVRYLNSVLAIPSPTPEEARANLEKYLTALAEFTEATAESVGTNKAYPFPEEEDYLKCVREARSQDE